MSVNSLYIKPNTSNLVLFVRSIVFNLLKERFNWVKRMLFDILIFDSLFLERPSIYNLVFADRSIYSNMLRPIWHLIKMGLHSKSTVSRQLSPRSKWVKPVNLRRSMALMRFLLRIKEVSRIL
jgi:hypothetical protein